MKRSILCILPVLLLCTVQAGALTAQSLQLSGQIGPVPVALQSFDVE